MPSLLPGLHEFHTEGPVHGKAAMEDRRREEDDRYAKFIRNNGPSFDRFNTDYLDQSSLSELNDPKFEVDHLATFSAGTKNGIIQAEDGLRKLRQMENTTGIWTMRCLMVVEREHLVILDNSTGEELERLPVSLVHDPTAIFKNDSREIYNNLLLFTILDDPKKRTSQADMHIFQSSRAPAQEIVDEILAAKSGQQQVNQATGARLVNTGAGSQLTSQQKAYNFQGMREFIEDRHINHTNFNGQGGQFAGPVNQSGFIGQSGQFAGPVSQSSYIGQGGQFAGAVNQSSFISPGGQFAGPVMQQERFISQVNTVALGKEHTEGGNTEVLEKDVQLLNHCFDDIEKFVARLQQAAEAYKELEKRKKDRGGKNKKRQSGDGMLSARARPPPDRSFVDIFQKFKLSFNLLAKLKAHIHDPNAPELVHFLFTPLSLIYEASRDPYHGNQNLGDQAVAPLLTSEAKQLLLNCLTSKEIELWQALGKNWTTSRDDWQGPTPSYMPEFYDGWNPAAGLEDTRSSVAAQPAVMSSPLAMIEQGRTQAILEDRQRNLPARSLPFQSEPMTDRFQGQDDFGRFEPPARLFRQDSDEFRPSRFEPGLVNSTSKGFEPQLVSGFQHLGLASDPQLQTAGRGGPFSPEAGDLQAFDRMNGGAGELQNIERGRLSPSTLTRHEDNMAYLQELRRLPDVKIYEAVHERKGKNNKELSVQRGDILRVIDDSKNWWKLQNFKGETGFAPYTIIKPVTAQNDDPFHQASQQDQRNHPRVPRAETPDRFLRDEGERGYREQVASWYDRQQFVARPRSVSPQPDRRYVTPPGRDQPFGSHHLDSRTGLKQSTTDVFRRSSPSPERQESSRFHEPRLLPSSSPPRRIASLIQQRNVWSSREGPLTSSPDRRRGGHVSRSPDRRRSRSQPRHHSPVRERYRSPGNQHRFSRTHQRRYSLSPIPQSTRRYQSASPVQQRYSESPEQVRRETPSPVRARRPNSPPNRRPPTRAHQQSAQHSRASRRIGREASFHSNGHRSASPTDRTHSPEVRSSIQQPSKTRKSIQDHSSSRHQRAKPHIRESNHASDSQVTRHRVKSHAIEDSAASDSYELDSGYENEWNKPTRNKSRVPPYINAPPNRQSIVRSEEKRQSTARPISPQSRGLRKTSGQKKPPGHVPPPPPVPPPLPPRPLDKQNQPIRSRADPSIREERKDDDRMKASLHQELQERMRRPRSFRKPSKEQTSKHSNRINQDSTPEEVWRWMGDKGFSRVTMNTFRDYNGADMFQLRLLDIKEAIGHEEAVRLDGLLTLQKNFSGYGTRSANELNEILRRRKQELGDDEDSEDSLY